MNSNQYEEEYDLLEEEEIDIVKLVSTNANDANQYLLFHGKDKQYYAKNVSKIEEVVVLKDLNIIKNYDHNLIIGVADIRGEMLSLVNFDSWLTKEEYDENFYEFVIILNYAETKFGLVVKNVEYITTIEPVSMHSTTSGNSKSTFTTKINVNNNDVLCTIIDSDRLLLDAFEEKDSSSQTDIDNLNYNINSNKKVLLADDSRLIQKLFNKICTELNLNYQVFSNGKELLDEVYNTKIEDIGLIVTDIEMPVLGGKEVIRQLNKDSKFDNINILAHTNMANEIMKRELIEIGAKDIISKIDMKTLGSAIKNHIK